MQQVSIHIVVADEAPSSSSSSSTPQSIRIVVPCLHPSNFRYSISRARCTQRRRTAASFFPPSSCPPDVGHNCRFHQFPLADYMDVGRLHAESMRDVMDDRPNAATHCLFAVVNRSQVRAAAIAASVSSCANVTVAVVVMLTQRSWCIQVFDGGNQKCIFVRERILITITNMHNNSAPYHSLYIYRNTKHVRSTSCCVDSIITAFRRMWQLCSID